MSGPRRFTHNDEVWTAASSGVSHQEPGRDHFQVNLVRESDGLELTGWVSQPDVAGVSETEFPAAVERGWEGLGHGPLTLLSTIVDYVGIGAIGGAARAYTCTRCDATLLLLDGRLVDEKGRRSGDRDFRRCFP